MKNKVIMVALAALGMTLGSVKAITLEELETRVTDLETAVNKVIENVKETNELVNKMSDSVYNIERRQKQMKEDKERAEGRTARTRPRSER